jgi:DNA-binding CsgD family transcriptional regulator
VDTNNGFILGGHVTPAHVADTTEFDRLLAEANLSPDAPVLADKRYSSMKNRTTLKKRNYIGGDYRAEESKRKYPSMRGLEICDGDAEGGGCPLKDRAFEKLVSATHAVMAKQHYLSPKVTDVVVGECLRHLPGNEPTAFTVPTTRERGVFQLMAEKKTAKHMASILGVSVKIVKTRRQQIMEKPDMHSITELIKYVNREGLTSLEPQDLPTRPLPCKRLLRCFYRGDTDGRPVECYLTS